MSSDPHVRSYLFLRRAVGIIGMALPAAVIIGEPLLGKAQIMNSVSSYYNTSMRDVYVGALCAVGVFLLSYRGYDRVDNLVSNIGAIAAVGAAMFPTMPPREQLPDGPTRAQQIVDAVHIGFGALFLLTLAYLCLFQFVKSGQAPPTVGKQRRNRVYRGCGLIIVGCLALMVVLGWILDARVGHLHPVLWLEAVAILAFGVAWLIKGDTVLRDPPVAPEQRRPAADPALV